MRRYEAKQIADALKTIIAPYREHEEYPDIYTNVAYFVYDICTELRIPERLIYEILGYRGYLHVAKTRYYATPEGREMLEEALNRLLNEDLEEDNDEEC